MTREETRKRQELTYAKLLAERMALPWLFEATEAPDFIVTDGHAKFGLEVTNIYGDEGTKGGSQMARNEAIHQSRVNALRAAYEAIHPIPLIVRFSSDLDKLGDGEPFVALERSRIHELPPGHQETLVIGTGIKAGVTRGKDHADWYLISDRIGWVNTNAQELVKLAISRKTKHREKYVRRCGADVRLLIVADEIMNSGKLRPSYGKFDSQGFHKIYLLNYPASATILCEAV